VSTAGLATHTLDGRSECPLVPIGALAPTTPPTRRVAAARAPADAAAASRTPPARSNTSQSRTGHPAAARPPCKSSRPRGASEPQPATQLHTASDVRWPRRAGEMGPRPSSKAAPSARCGRRQPPRIRSPRPRTGRGPRPLRTVRRCRQRV